MSRFKNSSLHAVIRKVEFYDFLLFIYIVGFVREFFWVVHYNAIAWTLTVMVSISLTASYVTFKKTSGERRSAAFWTIVGLPLFFCYALRFAYPDLSFDVLNYHIFHSERALRGLLHISGDFAPAYFPFLNNPVADVITGIFRHILGFRLGTVVNYLALLWTGAILYDFFKRYISSSVGRSLAVLLILMSEQLLFEVSNYMIDLLALPIMLQATLLVVSDDQKSPLNYKDVLLVSLLSGMATALKLTNLVFAVPLVVLAIVRYKASNPTAGRHLSTAVLSLVLFFVPMLPYMIYVFWLTGNPTFPYFNKIFRSPYWPIENAFDARWGPRGTIETLLWPVEIPFKTQRLSELGVYSGRMSLGVITAILVLVFARRDKRLRLIAFIMILGAVLWSAGTGYIRYGLYLEVLGGVTIVALGLMIWRSKFSLTPLTRSMSLLVWSLLVAQAALGFVYFLGVEWGGRSIAKSDYRYDVAELFRDRSLTRYLTSDEAQLFDDVDVWVESSYKTSALAAMLHSDIPYLNVFADNFVGTPAARERFQTALETVADRKMLSLVFQEDLDMALSKLESRRFSAQKIIPIKFPYYSSRHRLDLFALEVVPKPDALEHPKQSFSFDKRGFSEGRAVARRSGRAAVELAEVTGRISNPPWTVGLLPRTAGKDRFPDLRVYRDR